MGTCGWITVTQPLAQARRGPGEIVFAGTTADWINDQEGRPFFVVNTAAHPGLIAVLRQKIIPRLLTEVPHQPSEEELKGIVIGFGF